MSRAGRPLPTPSDDEEANVVADVGQHGWHVVLVRAAIHDHDTAGPWSEHPAAQAAYEAQFAYTVGLGASFAHPEVILVGSWQHAHPFLNAVGDLVRDGARFADADTSADVLDGFVVRFDAVSQTCATELLTWAHWAAGRQAFDALQLVLPDTCGRWPEEDGYNGFPQPSLRV